MKPGSPKLSEVARHIVQPAGIVATDWADVGATCNNLGWQFDRWQDGAGRLILAQRQGGRFAAGIGGVHLSWPRQVGKTYLIGAIIIALCLLKPGMLALWTAHHGKTINETFRAMQALAKRSKIAPHVRRITTGNGDEGIEFRNGSRLLFGAREHGFGLGFSKVSLIVFDEAQRLKSRTIVDMVPTTNAAANPLVFYIGTPPRPEDPGEVFVSRRSKALAVEAARAAGDDPKYNALYIELGADPSTPRDLVEIDWEQLGRANPSYPHRVDRESIERMWEQFVDKDDFWREGYGIWDELASTRALINYSSEWKPLHVEIAPPKGVQAYGVKFSPDGARVSLAAARRPEDGPTHVEVVKVTTTAAGTAWLVDWLVARWRKAAVIVIDGKAGTGPLVTALRKRGVPKSRIVTPTLDQVIEAHAGLYEAVKTRELSHYGQTGLDEIVQAATKRPIGRKESGGWGWQPIGDDVDVTPLEAVTYAHYGATTTRRKPTDDGDQASSWGGRAVVA